MSEDSGKPPELSSETSEKGDGCKERRESESGSHNESIDPYFVPVVTLPEVDVPTGEDEEKEVFRIRAKLYRFDSSEDPAQWKERGTGDIKILEHEGGKHVRVLMRREKTLKICANHFVRPWMILKPMKENERAWMWQVFVDFADEEPKQELFAIKFSSVENAEKFKKAFDDAVLKTIEEEAKIILTGEGREDNGEIAIDNHKKDEYEVVEKIENLEISATKNE